MALSTFSSDSRLKWTLLTLAIGTALLCVYNLALWKIRQSDPGGGRAEGKYWLEKIHPKQKYNIVFLGDSRCVHGVDPAYLEKRAGLPAYNAAFFGGGLNRTIFEHMEKKLLKGSSAELRCVVLSLSIVTLSSIGEKNEHFHQLSERFKDKKMPKESVIKMLFKTFDIKEVRFLWGRGLSRAVCHSNGYFELRRPVRERSRRRALRYYDGFLKSAEFPPRIMKDILSYTRKWRENNISVLAFHIPSSPVFQAMEEKVPGWDMVKFKKEFEAAGGTLISIDNMESYNAYDAVHLNHKDADRLSRELSEKICRTLGR